MQAIIFANRTGDELAPLDQYYCPALLPIGNKSAIEYTLEDIASSGITKVKLIISSQAQEIEQRLGDGKRWGLDIEYFLSKPQEKTTSVLGRLSISSDDQILIVRGDIFRSPCITDFINFSKQFSNGFVQAKMANQNAAMMLLPAALPYLDGIDWPLTQPSDNTSVVTLVLHGLCNRLDSFQAYMQVNVDLANNRIPFLSPIERPVMSANPEQDFYVGAKANTGDLTLQNAWGIIGENSWVSPNVKMKNTIIIGNNSLIDNNSTLENCLILPHTYVGEGLEVNNSILCQKLLISLDNGGVIEIDDQALIGPSEHQVPIKSTKTHLSTRFIVFMLLIASLPLWPLSACYTLIYSLLSRVPTKLLNHEVINDNLGKELTTYSLNVPSRILSLLPHLFLVLTGQLDLFGAPAQVRFAAEQDKQRRGVFGPIQLLLGNDAPEEERLLLTLEFDNNHHRTKYITLLWDAFNMPVRSFIQT
ncbi:NDP-sugar synthase [Shewanella sp. VB17]|uniref:sugar phosphate nucleotidyltransferase n=1 Tax=Shewanella sp. VB17 TaxID=2739432 RepID=UPI0015676F8F|nr:NDP-sugar synthase [Shewanella sp. VB17]NRD74671.1 NDP-sugar synthase [Shewanella sp. VB17]